MFFHLTPGFDFKRERGGARWSQTFGGDCSLRQGVLCAVIFAAQLMYVSSMEWPSINILSSHSLICLIVLHGSNMGRPRWKVTFKFQLCSRKEWPTERVSQVEKRMQSPRSSADSSASPRGMQRRRMFRLDRTICQQNGSPNRAMFFFSFLRPNMLLQDKETAQM